MPQPPLPTVFVLIHLVLNPAFSEHKSTQCPRSNLPPKLPLAAMDPQQNYTAPFESYSFTASASSSSQPAGFKPADSDIDHFFDFDAYSSPFLGVPDMHTDNSNNATPFAMPFEDLNMGYFATPQATPSAMPNGDSNNVSSMQKGHSIPASSESQGLNMGPCGSAEVG